MRTSSLGFNLKTYIEEQNAPFSMPGHKYGRAFNKEIDGISLENLLSWDMTEVEGLDNLHHPEQCIKEAQMKLSKLYKSHKSYFLVNGSTCGNLVMLFSAFDEGDYIIVERNCHRSISNGIIMRKLKPIYVENIYSNILKEPIGMDLEDLKTKLNKYRNIKGIILTYPNYYGIGYNIENIVRLCKEKNIKILIDSAHGAHFGFHDDLPFSAQELDADMVVMSAHKTLPSLTQTAYLHLNNAELLEKVEFYLSVFMSTSPSYIFMASLDYSRAFLEYESKQAYDELFKNIENVKKSIDILDYIRILNKETLIEEGFNNIIIDKSRIVINLEEPYSGHKLLRYLRENRVQAEMSSNKSVVLIPSPFNIKEDFEQLKYALINCPYNELIDEEVPMIIGKIPKLKLLPYEAMERKKIYITIEEALGKIVGENIIPYPPGVPLLIMGEEIEQEHIDTIKSCLINKVTVIGVNDNKIKILK